MNSEPSSNLAMLAIDRSPSGKKGTRENQVMVSRLRMAGLLRRHQQGVWEMARSGWRRGVEQIQAFSLRRMENLRQEKITMDESACSLLAEFYGQRRFLDPAGSSDNRARR